mmetsp:Transcript_3871/g.9736  ORF Transcript_3871/g.9736 Transcript_3871/m.9736 type:complete len:235 (+) Transcript_3871:895-1599(+)
MGVLVRHVICAWRGACVCVLSCVLIDPVRQVHTLTIDPRMVCNSVILCSLLSDLLLCRQPTRWSSSSMLGQLHAALEPARHPPQSIVTRQESRPQPYTPRSAVPRSLAPPSTLSLPASVRQVGYLLQNVPLPPLPRPALCMPALSVNPVSLRHTDHLPPQGPQRIQLGELLCRHQVALVLVSAELPDGRPLPVEVPVMPQQIDQHVLLRGRCARGAASGEWLGGRGRTHSSFAE